MACATTARPDRDGPVTNTPTSAIELRTLRGPELARLGEIDRSEHITATYRFAGRSLIRRDEDIHATAWQGGSGEHSLMSTIRFCQDHLEHGGTALGAFADDGMVGIGIVSFEVAPATAQLAFLHVTRKLRRTGLGRKLTRKLCALAAERGAQRLYVSATPSESAVSFYLSEGFKPTEPIPHLFELEPEDIHMLRELS